MIQAGGFSSFVDDVLEAVQHDKDERMMWDYYLHKVRDGRSFNDFRKSIQDDVDHRNMSQGDISDIVQNSMNILNNFNPN